MAHVEEAIELAMALVKPFEGFRAAPYQCSARVWTIGYGTTRVNGAPVNIDTPEVDEPTAEQWAKEDLEWRLRAVRRLVVVPLRPRQEAALIDFCYNLGTGALKASTLRSKLNRGDYEGAAGEFRRWVFAGGRRLRGLVKRRAAEKRMFLYG